MTCRIRNRAYLVSVTILLALAACRSPVNTVPAPLAPQDPVHHYDLEIPDALEVRLVSFDASTFGHVSGNEYGVGTKVGGRAFLKVYAVHRHTGDQYLLIYEDVVHRKTPAQVIRFRAVADSRMLTPGSE